MTELTIAETLERPAGEWVEQVMRRQRASLAWQPAGRRPLGIWVNRPENRADLMFEDIFDYRSFFRLQVRILADTLSVGSDLMPVLAINNFGDGILPSLFGADLVVPPPTVDVIQDLGPWVVPFLHSPGEMAAVRQPRLGTGLFARAADAVRYYRDHAPDWLPVVTPMRLGPLSVAMLLCGQPFYTHLHDHPREVHHLLQVCTDLFLEAEPHLFALAGMDRRDTITNFGISLQGAIRIGDDVLINLSPEMLEEFAIPYYRQIALGFGGRVLLHFCSMPQARGSHVIQTLARHPDVFVGASTQLGAEYYLEHQEGLQGQLGIEAGYGVGISSYKQSFGSFGRWAERLTSESHANTGLVLYTEVASLADARAMWQDWMQVQRRRS